MENPTKALLSIYGGTAKSMALDLDKLGITHGGAAITPHKISTWARRGGKELLVGSDLVAFLTASGTPGLDVMQCNLDCIRTLLGCLSPEGTEDYSVVPDSELQHSEEDKPLLVDAPDLQVLTEDFGGLIPNGDVSEVELELDDLSPNEDVREVELELDDLSPNEDAAPFDLGESDLSFLDEEGHREKTKVPEDIPPAYDVSIKDDLDLGALLNG